MVKPVHKPFSKSNYEANDFSAKKAVISFLERLGLSVIENPDRYGVDLIANGITHNGLSLIHISEPTRPY